MLDHRKNLRAFSLIELLIALSILAVVAALVVPKFLNANQQAQFAVLNSNLAQMNNIYFEFSTRGGQVQTSTAYPEAVTEQQAQWASEIFPFLSVTVSQDPWTNSNPTDSRSSKDRSEPVYWQVVDSPGTNGSWPISAQIAWDTTPGTQSIGAGTPTFDASAPQNCFTVRKTPAGVYLLYYRIGNIFYNILWDPTRPDPFYYNVNGTPVSTSSSSVGVNVTL